MNRHGLENGDRRPSFVGLWVAVAVGLSALGWWVWKPTPNPPAPGSPIGSRTNSSTASLSNTVFELEAEGSVFSRYAGSKACQECHLRQHAAWHGSNHGLAERPPSEDFDRAAFDPPRRFPHGTQETRVAWRDGRPFVASPGLDGKSDELPVVRVIGHAPLRQFLVGFPGGRLQTLEASWDPRTNEWFNVYGAEDRQPGEWGHWTGRGMTWNAMCGTCHNTRFRKNYEPAADAYRTSMAEPTVGCEACHGPMKSHAEWQRTRKDTPGQGREPDLRKRTPGEYMEACASCHARRGEVTGDFVPGESFWDHFVLTTVDETDVFYPDGQVREEDYEYAAFLGSRMHAAGVTCLDCHDSHAARPKLPGNELCLRCHNGSRQGAPVVDPTLHSRHAAGIAGSACVDCHMPTTVFMQRHARHDHGFTSPDPWLTREFGIPNACNRCHADRDTEWAIATCESWYGAGKMERPARDRTRAIARARRGEPEGRDGLLELLRSREGPYWKASAVALLGRWIDEPRVRSQVLGELRHESPLVRHRAVQALALLVEAGDRDAAEAIRRGLDDSSRGVRVAAAWALRGSPGGTTDSTARSELRHMLAWHSDQPTGQAQLAVQAMDEGRLDAALQHYARAVAWDPRSGAIRQDYAVALSSAGRNREAVEQIRGAIRWEPRIAEHHYRLGLALHELEELVQATAALEEAVRLDSRHDRALYNLGLAYHQLVRSDEALTVLERASTLRPDDPRAPYARATIFAELGRQREARTAAEEAVRRQAGFTPAIELLRELGR